MSSDLAAISYGYQPAVLIFSSDAAERNRLGSLIAGTGARLSVSACLSHAAARIESHAAPGGVVIDLRAAPLALGDALLDLMEANARAERFASIALIKPAQIDRAAALTGHADVQLLCEPSDADLVAALGTFTLPPRDYWLHDVTAEAAPHQLRQLSEEVERIARTLAALSDRDYVDPAVSSAEAELPKVPIIDAAMIRAIIRARRLRDHYFNASLFADAIWDMLLDLMAAQLEGKQVAVSSLCIAAAVPPTTALRAITTMTEAGLLNRIADPRDRRRIFIGLSENAAEAMLAYLSAVQAITALPA